MTAIPILTFFTLLQVGCYRTKPPKNTHNVGAEKNGTFISAPSEAYSRL